ncbi:hypothetical protein ABIE64_004373 [Thalassospira sp. MBR-102]|jgi:hypothetical protein|uniref:Lipoprotein n=1 Tax=Thalassospira xiamenensis M-5 = DSM 17429 TaxID=1123366 RepID=A0AB72UF78_9PROT|nr:MULTISPECIES: hypothetical protein [Thalassospira]AJD52748.1 hypothetical protein TH3_13160 [Thalassospira xiamenensis M-5 = DSM 17429]KZB64655.1 hypothetical protein AUQ42_14645 [Thalassospira sp. MCCC 1A02491]MBP3128289.1 hypothetical protein [Thalassospira sp. ER-Se-21-Dark]|tara:strand:+ start:150 stop:335 length:186 start_codon:yes stop_codon:yes gene_type:complete
MRLIPKHFVPILCLVVFLSGCVSVSKDREIPKDGTGTDEMKLSPCVCNPVEFNGEGFSWLG